MPRAPRRSLREVVLHDDDARGTGAFRQERGGLLHVVKDVDEQRGVRGSVRDGQVRSVERTYRQLDREPQGQSPA